MGSRSTSTRNGTRSGRRSSSTSSVDFFATERHYVDHLAPIWKALEPDERGTFVVVDGPLEAWAARRGVDATVATLEATDRATVVASFGDYQRARARRRSWVCLVEHGAGQTYRGDPHSSIGTHGAYAGGLGREDVALFLCPNEPTAEANRATYPDTPAVVVGCPKLDPWADRALRRNDPPIVAVSFHWNAEIVPEARSAWPHYAAGLAALATSGRVRLVGHGHPRIADRLRAAYNKAGIVYVDDFAHVLDLADVYACDNSSTLYEFATVGPVVALNAPWYRREIEHGGRFWNLIPGLSCDDPIDLEWSFTRALEDPPAARRLRARALEIVYPMRDGHASERAAEAIRHYYPGGPE